MSVFDSTPDRPRSQEQPDHLVTFYIDGLCEPSNPNGFACWAYVTVDENGREIALNFGCVGHGVGMTNNIAEYHAFIEALKRAKAEGWIGCEIRSDSQLVVNQVIGSWRCNAQNLLPLLREDTQLMDELGSHATWIPREENERADHLSRVAYNKARLTL